MLFPTPARRVPGGDGAGSATSVVILCLASFAGSLAGGGCATSGPAASARDAAPLSEALVRLRASDGAAERPGVPVRGSSASGPSSNVIGDAGRTATPSRPFPRALDPVPPLYAPPPRRLVLQPILDTSRPMAGDGIVSRGPVPYRDPLGPADPLRRVDPVSGRDPLGRLDPTGGVDIDPPRPPFGLDARR